MTPAPTTLSVDSWSGLIVGLYEAASRRQIETAALNVLI